MKFRLKALGVHLLSSAAALGLVLGILFLGWYKWPGWYLADAAKVIQVMVLVDVVVGPLLTLVIASPSKLRRELQRDVGVIVAVQLIALSYGSLQLWNGRPLYYAFSDNYLQTIQAYDIPRAQADIGREKNPALAPHCYNGVRWISVPLPEDPLVREQLLASIKKSGDELTSMPLYYRTWESSLPALKLQLKKVDDVGYMLLLKDKASFKAQMQTAGLDPNQANSMALAGRGHPLLAVFDLNTLKPIALFRSQ